VWAEAEAGRFQISAKKFRCEIPAPKKALRLLMLVRHIVRSQISHTSLRPFYSNLRRYSIMEGGLSTQELEEAIKNRLSAVHAEVRDISGTGIPPPSTCLIGRWMWSII